MPMKNSIPFSAIPVSWHFEWNADIWIKTGEDIAISLSDPPVSARFTTLSFPCFIL